jgi:hypothetical protein
MERTSIASTRIAQGFLAALFAVNVYRAITQSVTTGEAWSYNHFIGPAWTEALAHFDGNNHVLNTLLVRISTSRFHLTELSMRLPSLLAGVFYLWVVFRMARRWFGDGWMFLFVTGLLTLNPVIVDAMSEARGYGMALACFMWALELILESVEPFSAQKLNLAGLCLGLSVAASLAFVAPVAALIGVYLAWSRTSGSARPADRNLALIALLTAFVLLVIPLNHAEWTTLAAGATSLRQTINELTALSMRSSLEVIGAIARVAVALVALGGVIAAVRQWRHRDGALVVLAGSTLALTLVLLLAAHRWRHTPFPQEGAIYLIPLLVLTVAGGTLKLHSRPAQIAFLSVSGVVLACHLVAFPWEMYASGRQFAGGRSLAKALRRDAGTGPVRIGASLAAEPIVTYYRARYRQGNWQPVERQPLTGSYDYYVLTAADAGLIEQRHLQVLYREGGLTLAQ